LVMPCKERVRRWAGSAGRDGAGRRLSCSGAEGAIVHGAARRARRLHRGRGQRQDGVERWTVGEAGGTGLSGVCQKVVQSTHIDWNILVHQRRMACNVSAT
jgi:hypothetical protein